MNIVVAIIVGLNWCSRMHQNAPFRRRTCQNFSREGAQPLPRPHHRRRLHASAFGTRPPRSHFTPPVTVGSLVPRFLLLYILLYHFTTRLAFVAPTSPCSSRLRSRAPVCLGPPKDCNCQVGHVTCFCAKVRNCRNKSEVGQLVCRLNTN